MSHTYAFETVSPSVWDEWETEFIIDEENDDDFEDIEFEEIELDEEF